MALREMPTADFGDRGDRRGAYSWKILLSGYAPLYTYERGRLDTSLPFEELKRRSHINAAAQAADQAADFSQRIRAELPKPAAGDAYK